MPTTRVTFWRRKFEDNKRRDARNRRDLTKRGWSAMTVWECQLTPGRIQRTTRRIIAFLGSG